MNVFLIGGTKFTGPPLIRELVSKGHEVTYFHRGETHDPRTADATAILGDRKDVSRLSEAIAGASPDIVVDMIPFTAEDATTTKMASEGVAPRLIALSSIDVYIAYGRIHRSEPGPVQPTPLLESAELRKTDKPQGPEYDKIAIERILMDNPNLPATVLRLPAIYGPKDKHRRLRSYLKRMDDGRDFILLSESISDWKFSRGYADNVAHAITRAIEHESSANEVYNVAEPKAMTELDFVRAIGKAANWQGEIHVVPDDSLPPYLKPEVDFGQNWDVDSSKIRSQLGYSEIVTIPDAILRTIEWERADPPDSEPFEIDYDAEDRCLAN